MKYFYLYFLAAVAAIVVTTIWPTSNRVKKLEAYRLELTQDIKKLRGENKLLQEKIKALKSDPYFLEATLRQKFHLIRQGEIILQ